jgi:hypothetical protein
VRVRTRPCGELLDHAQLAHRRDQPRPVQLGHLARVRGGERVAAALGLVEQRVDGRLRVFGAADQVTEVPGDLLQLGIGEGFRGSHRP